MLLFLLLFALGANAVTAQISDGTAVLEALNERLASIPKGVFTLDAQFKYASKEDTIAHSGTCYFFREANPDSMAHFVVVSDGRPVLAFDGKTFYQAIGEDKYLVTETATAGGVQKLLQGNVMKSNLVYQPFLQIDASSLSLFEKSGLTAFRENGKSLLRLTVRDTSIEEAFGNVANNKIYFALHFDIVLPEYELVRRTEEVWLFDSWQYDRKVFGPIRTLPAEARFSDYFDPEKLATRYTFEQYDPNAPVKRDVQLIRAGDLLPDFTLPDLEGKTVSLADQKSGLVLLDFWYKSCMPCQLAMPKVESLHQKFGDKGLKVFGINPYDKNRDQIRDWLRKRNVTYNTLFDLENKLPKAVGIGGYPLLIIADAQTREVLFVQPGYNEEMEQTLESIIADRLR